jgi:hypothetical protein
MMRWTGRIMIAAALAWGNACAGTHHPAVSDGAAEQGSGSAPTNAPTHDAGLRDAASSGSSGQTGGSADAQRDASKPALQTPVVPGFMSIAVEPAGHCSNARSGLVVRSPRRVLVATGCGLYAVDTAEKTVVQLDTRGEALDDDGDTVAVIGGAQLGLSLDGGSTFAWVDWQLGRCQGVPNLTAGDGFAVVTCVAGIGRWRGAGSDFEMLQPGSRAPVTPAAAARGSNLLVAESDGWFVSTDRGDHFTPFVEHGLPEHVQAYGMKIVGSKVFVPNTTEPDDALALYAAPIPGGGFVPVTGLPPSQGAGSLSTGAGSLLVHTTNEFLLSRNGGESFVELSVERFAAVTAVARYADGNLYVLNDGTLSVAAVPQ